MLGELEEWKDRLAASEAARKAADKRAQAAESRCSDLEAQASRSRSLAESLELLQQELKVRELPDNHNRAYVATTSGGMHVA